MAYGRCLEVHNRALTHRDGLEGYNDVWADRILQTGINRFARSSDAVQGHISAFRQILRHNATARDRQSWPVNAIQQGNNWYGQMILDGNINSFSIGGQELYLDDVCCDK